MTASLLIRRLSEREKTTAYTTRATYANDAAGGAKRTYANNLTGLVVHIQDKSGIEASRYGRDAARRFAIIYVDGISLDIFERDKIIVQKVGASDRTFDIQNVRPRGADNSLHTILDCEETVGGP
jgi:hypothetical protein